MGEEGKKPCDKLCLRNIADCKGKRIMAVIYILLTFIWIPLDGIWFYPVCVRAVVFPNFVSQRLFSPLFPFARALSLGVGVYISFSSCFVTVALSFAFYSISATYHDINPMFTQFTVCISNAQNPKTNKNIFCCCRHGFLGVWWKIFDVLVVCAIRNEMLTKWNETKRVIFSI